MMFTVNFYQNAVNSGTVLIEARALGLFQGNDLCKELEISSESSSDFWGAAHSSTTPGPCVRAISF